MKVVQYRCYRCKKTWTPATANHERGQKRRSENEILRRLLGSGMTMERVAWILQMSPNTVSKRVTYLAKIANEELDKCRQKGPKVDEVYLDELITFEHTRCKPLAVAMAVTKDREILGFEVSSMPPIGKHLAEISKKKYGNRPNHRKEGLESCLRQIAPRVLKSKFHEPQNESPESSESPKPDTPRETGDPIVTRFHSDEEPSYPQIVESIFPGSKHKTYPSKRAVVAGQGELKVRTYDPLFPINHTFAMLRANLARLIRRTWSTTKKMARLRDFLAIYAHMHNTLLIRQTPQSLPRLQAS